MASRKYEGTQRTARIHELAAKGLSVSVIAERLGISINHVSVALGRQKRKPKPK